MAALFIPIAACRTTHNGDVAGSAMQAGLEDHVQCAVQGKSEIQPYPLETKYTRLADIAQSLSSDYNVVAAHHCSQSGRRFAHVVLQSDHGPVSLILSDKQTGENLSSSRNSQIELPDGLVLNEARAEPYEIAAFETPSHLAFVVSSLPRETNRGIMRRIALDVRSLLNLFRKEGRFPGPESQRDLFALLEPRDASVGHDAIHHVSTGSAPLSTERHCYTELIDGRIVQCQRDTGLLTILPFGDFQ